MGSGRSTAHRYSLAEKQRAVRAVEQLRKELGTEHGTVKRVADQLGIGVESLRGWVKQAEIDAGKTPGVTTGEAARIGELEQELRELRRANAILRSEGNLFLPSAPLHGDKWAGSLRRSDAAPSGERGLRLRRSPARSSIHRRARRPQPHQEALPAMHTLDALLTTLALMTVPTALGAGLMCLFSPVRWPLVPLWLQLWTLVAAALLAYVHRLGAVAVLVAGHHSARRFRPLAAQLTTRERWALRVGGIVTYAVLVLLLPAHSTTATQAAVAAVAVLALAHPWDIAHQ
jgi:transposase